MNIDLSSGQARYLTMKVRLFRQGVGIVLLLITVLYGCTVFETRSYEWELAWQPNSESLALSGSGLWLYTDNLQIITDFSTNKDSESSGLAWSSDGSKLAEIACSVRIWDVGTKQVIKDLTNGVRASTVAWSPDGKRIAVGMIGNIISIWDAETFSSTISLKEHSEYEYEYVNVVLWNPDSTRIASVSSDKSVRIWDPTTGQILHHLPTTMGMYTAAWNSKGNQLAIAGSGEEFQVWDTDKGQLLQSIPLNADGRSASSVAWSSDDEQLAVAIGKTIHIWDILSWQKLHTIDAHDGTIDSIIWSPDGTELFSVGTDKMIRKWHRDTAEMLAEEQIRG